MLSTQDIAKLIENPRLMDRTEIEQLRQLTDRFPFSQVFSILYLKALALSQDVLLDDEIQRLAIRIQDRTVLYNLINSPLQSAQVADYDSTVIETSSIMEEEISKPVEVETTTFPVEKVSSPIENPIEIIEEVKVEEEIILPHKLTIEELVENEIHLSEPTDLEETESSIADSTDYRVAPEIKSQSSNIPPISIEEEEVNAIPTEDIEANVDNVESFDREQLEQQLQLERAIELQKQHDLERQKLIEKLTVKPKSEVVQENHPVEPKMEVRTENIGTHSEIESRKIEDTSGEKSFTSWLKTASKSITEKETNEPVKIEPKLPHEEENLVPSAVYLLEKEENITENSVENQAQDKPKKKDVTALIDKFIKEDPRITSPKRTPEKPVVTRTEMYNPTKKGKESLNDAQLPVSETLAKIFVVQGNFPKAIFAYQQLMLIFPEKKTFFAKQIKELEKKLNTK